MGNFNFYDQQGAYGAKFFQFPQVLLYGAEYKGLSDSARLGYMVLRDRLQYSLQHNWIDEDQHVYFIFTNDELHDLFGWGKAKIVRVKKELEDANLLRQFVSGFDPKLKKNLPNRLYLADLEVTAKDVYSLQKQAETLGMTGSSKMEPRQDFSSDAETLGMTGSSKMEPRQENAETLDTTGSSKVERNLYNTNTDTYRDIKDPQNLDSSKSTNLDPELEKMILSNFEFNTNPEACEVLSEESLHALGLWSDSVDQAYKRVGLVLSAKRNTELEYGGILTFSARHKELHKALMRVITAWKLEQDGVTEKKVKDWDNYLYGAFKNVFENAMQEIILENANSEEERAEALALFDRFADPKTGRAARSAARKNALRK